MISISYGLIFTPLSHSSSWLNVRDVHLIPDKFWCVRLPNYFLFHVLLIVESWELCVGFLGGLRRTVTLINWQVLITLVHRLIIWFYYHGITPLAIHYPIRTWCTIPLRYLRPCIAVLYMLVKLCIVKDRIFVHLPPIILQTTSMQWRQQVRLGFIKCHLFNYLS